MFISHMKYNPAARLLIVLFHNPESMGTGLSCLTCSESIHLKYDNLRMYRPAIYQPHSDFSLNHQYDKRPMSYCIALHLLSLQIYASLAGQGLFQGISDILFHESFITFQRLRVYSFLSIKGYQIHWSIVSASRIVSSYCSVMEMTDKGLCTYSAALPSY